MDQAIKDIFAAFDGKLIGTKAMQYYVCEVVMQMPPRVIGKITKTSWFISSLEDAWAFTLRGNDFQNQYLILLSDDLLQEHHTQIRYSIAHEIGHVMLGHRNSIMKKQTRQEIAAQEAEADAFAREQGFSPPLNQSLRR